MERSDRRFTILDFLVLTVVMAGASLAARSEAFVTADEFRRAAAVMRVSPGAPTGGFAVVPGSPRARLVPVVAGPRWGRLWGEPGGRSQLRSTRLVLMESVKNIAVPDSTRLLWTYPGDRGYGLFLLRQCVVLLFPVLAGLSFALPLLRLVPPRPASPQLARQPGVWACLAAIAALLTAFWVEELWKIRLSLAAVGVAVALSWLGLALSRRWRAERSWLDRAGRALGVGWILAGALAAL